VLETRSHRTTCERHFAHSQTGKSTSCASFPYTYYNVYPKGRQAYSLLQTPMEPLPHGLWSCSSKPLTGRTGQVEGRFSYWNHHEPQPAPQEYSPGRGDHRLVAIDMPRRTHTPLRPHHTLQERRDHLATHTSQIDRLLRIVHPLDTNIVDTDTCPSLDTNDISLGHTPLS